jgi:hypothetical protein
MERECVARVKNVEALDVAFLDQRIPRYERDIINMVGMGVTEECRAQPENSPSTLHRRTVDLDEGDVINFPIGIYRGFRSLTEPDGR